jgi:choline dehydrogenase-like flavoprotein
VLDAAAWCGTVNTPRHQGSLGPALWKPHHAGDPQAQARLARTGYPTPANEHWFVDDLDNPYVEEQPFDWLRGYHVGGRSMHVGAPELSPEPDGLRGQCEGGRRIPWPVGYDEIAPWYDYAETFAGISGSVENLPQLPDGKFLPPHDLNCVERLPGAAQQKLDRRLIIGRCANLTAPLTHNESPQRGTCQAATCASAAVRIGGYFSSVSATLPSAERTGNMTLLPNKIAYEVIYDNDKGRATGVRVIDAKHAADRLLRQGDLPVRLGAGLGVHHAEFESSRFPNGFGNDSGELGHNIMDHNKPGG